MAIHVIGFVYLYMWRNGEMSYVENQVLQWDVHMRSHVCNFVQMPSIRTLLIIGDVHEFVFNKTKVWIQAGTEPPFSQRKALLAGMSKAASAVYNIQNGWTTVLWAVRI